MGSIQTPFQAGCCVLRWKQQQPQQGDGEVLSSAATTTTSVQLEIAVTEYGRFTTQNKLLVLSSEVASSRCLGRRIQTQRLYSSTSPEQSFAPPKFAAQDHPEPDPLSEFNSLQCVVIPGIHPFIFSMHSFNTCREFQRLILWCNKMFSRFVCCELATLT